MATTTVMKIDLSGYGANLKTPAQIAALTPCTINDFKVNMTYQVPWQVGEVNTGDDQNPVMEPRYILKTKYVSPYNVNEDLVHYQSRMRAGEAFSPGVAPSTTTVATTTIP